MSSFLKVYNTKEVGSIMQTQNLHGSGLYYRNSGNTIPPFRSGRLDSEPFDIATVKLHKVSGEDYSAVSSERLPISYFKVYTLETDGYGIISKGNYVFTGISQAAGLFYIEIETSNGITIKTELFEMSGAPSAQFSCSAATVTSVLYAGDTGVFSLDITRTDTNADAEPAGSIVLLIGGEEHNFAFTLDVGDSVTITQEFVIEQPGNYSVEWGGACIGTLAFSVGGYIDVKNSSRLFGTSKTSVLFETHLNITNVTFLGHGSFTYDTDGLYFSSSFIANKIEFEADGETYEFNFSEGYGYTTHLICKTDSSKSQRCFIAYGNWILSSENDINRRNGFTEIKDDNTNNIIRVPYSDAKTKIFTT